MLQASIAVLNCCMNYMIDAIDYEERGIALLVTR